jgi:cyclopropane fatty-acyl-phospholipid synthase-like methyltransferase
VTWALGQDEFIAGLFEPTYAGHIVDVGGGLGRTASLLAARYPAARVSLVEQAEVVDRAREAVEGTSVEVYSADDFVGRADRIIMTRVFCTLSDSDAFGLLSKVRGWISEGAEIHLIDSLSGDGGVSNYVDLVNLVRTGGSARTIEQWRDLVASCDLSISEIEPFKGAFSHIVLVAIDSATPDLQETFI